MVSANNESIEVFIFDFPLFDFVNALRNLSLLENLDHCYGGERLRLDVLHVIDRRRDRIFAEGRDLLRHLIGEEAGILPDDRDIDLGKDVCGRIFDRHDAEQQNKQRHHDKRVWTPER